MCYLVGVTEFVDLPGDQISFVLFHFNGVDVLLNRVHKPRDATFSLKSHQLKNTTLPVALQMIKPSASP